MDSRDSLENVESKWVGEIADNCQGVKLVLVALKCDLREAGDDSPEKNAAGGFIQYPEGLEVAQRIKVGFFLPQAHGVRSKKRERRELGQGSWG